MNKEAASKPVQEEVKESELVTQVVENQVVPVVESAPLSPNIEATTVPAGKKAAKKRTTKSQEAQMAKESEVNPSKEKNAEAGKGEKAHKMPKLKKQALKKPKLVRDSFTIPETDYVLFENIKQRALSAGIEVKKSEILRAAIMVIAALDDAELIKAIGLVERIKTGRPKK